MYIKNYVLYPVNSILPSMISLSEATVKLLPSKKTYWILNFLND